MQQNRYAEPMVIEGQNNLSGTWDTGHGDDVVQLLHCPQLGAFWSCHNQPMRESLVGIARQTPPSEAGALTWTLRIAVEPPSTNGTDCVRWFFGIANCGEGTATASPEGACIEWTNGNVWRCMESALPVSSSLTCAELFRAIYAAGKCHIFARPWLLKSWRCCGILLYWLAWWLLMQLMCLVWVSLGGWHELWKRHCHAQANVSWYLCIGFLATWLGFNVHTLLARTAAIRAANGICLLCRWGVIIICIVGVMLYMGPVLFGGKTVPLMVRFVAAGVIAAVVLISICWSRLQIIRSRAIGKGDPMTWPGIIDAEADVKEDVIQKFNEAQAKTQHYKFHLEVKDVYQVTGGNIEEHLCDISCDHTSTPNLGTQLLYHGAPAIAMKSIVANGFQLPRMCPPKGRMFGRGLYFADVPQKAWTFTNDCCFVLMCKVSLGHSKPLKQPDHTLDSRMLRQQSFRGSRYNSVLGCDREQGGSLNVKEYVIYDEAQAVPSYLLRVEEHPGTRLT